MGNSIIPFIIFFLLVGIAIYQLLLALGFPLGAAAWGGKHRILPIHLRIASMFSALFLVCMGILILQHTPIIEPFLPTHPILWVFTVFLGVNTVGNVVSQSKLERLIMTPISSILFLLCLLVALGY
ncbi:hypothetical protein [Pontibacillus yanchengensis]|uniref:Uncharacterized protein n=1 Tax=Pontibacillus yanchengensis Y32 TaxID=1385514 RepID=A0A0A2TTI1_9BACI|nr:hypothetical protein [Pontibacillus yanchengensis]KGP72585.1 hypothetical protein N782_11405 [Pontibacillus yanchengensis Y32]